MKWLKWLLIGLLVTAVVVVAAIYATGNGMMLNMMVGFALGKPDRPFDPADAVAAPDYSLEENWAALPDREDLADLIPAGIADQDMLGPAPVDVFFIHPTGFMKGSSWTFGMDPDTATEENTGWMMANQASAYNGCCSVFAPRYRQATIFAYFSGEDAREEALGFAYQDVARAFDYFLDHYNEGRPFIIASHSQGTHHGARLLKEAIDGTPLAQRLIAAYIIGGGISKSHFDGMRDITICKSPADLHCAVHWDTYSEAALDDPDKAALGNVCVNPLSWKPDGGLVSREHNAGAVPASGEFHVALMGSDSARGVVFEPLAAPIKALVQARCANGILYITDLSDTPFGQLAVAGSNYHGLDYPVFYMDIRENAKLRVATFLSQAVP